MDTRRRLIIRAHNAITARGLTVEQAISAGPTLVGTVKNLGPAGYDALVEAASTGELAEALAESAALAAAAHERRLAHRRTVAAHKR